MGGTQICPWSSTPYSCSLSARYSLVDVMQNRLLGATSVTDTTVLPSIPVNFNTVGYWSSNLSARLKVGALMCTT